MHALLIIVLCAAPALVLLPVWGLDREPSNAGVHDQEDAERGDPDDTPLGFTGVDSVAHDDAHATRPEQLRA